jgi:hypothetical protein
MLCAAGERASAASGAASPAGPALVALRLKVAPLADLGAADSDSVTRTTSVAGLGQRQWRRELRPRRHRLPDRRSKKNSTQPTSCGAGVRPSLEGLPYFGTGNFGFRPDMPPPHGKHYWT